MQADRTTTKYYYDDASGAPVEITSLVMSCSEIARKNMLDRTTPYGTTMPTFKPTGSGEFAPITIAALFEVGDGTLDELFGGRIPESNSAATRTFRIVYVSGREESVETHLSDYKVAPPQEGQLTRSTIILQPTGDVTEVIPT